MLGTRKKNSGSTWTGVLSRIRIYNRV